MTPIAPMQPTPPPTPGSHPLPDGPKPPSGAQVQASKSKTSRISLDSAIGVAPMTPMSGSRATKPSASSGRPTWRPRNPPSLDRSDPPDLAHSTTRCCLRPKPLRLRRPRDQKKTLKIKRPGAAVEAAPMLEGEASVRRRPNGAVSSLDIPQVREESKLFTGVRRRGRVCSNPVVLLLLTLCLGAHAVGTVANKNCSFGSRAPQAALARPSVRLTERRDAGGRRCFRRPFHFPGARARRGFDGTAGEHPEFEKAKIIEPSG